MLNAGNVTCTSLSVPGASAGCWPSRGNSSTLTDVRGGHAADQDARRDRAKFAPVIVTAVPPEPGPELGPIDETLGTGAPVGVGVGVFVGVFVAVGVLVGVGVGVAVGAPVKSAV